MHLLDFERAGYHHALIDAACAALCFPSCGHALLLPDDVRAAMLHAYRAEIAEACPEAGNDRRFGRELACVCAYWLVSNSNWMLREGLSRDETWGFATWRQRIMTRLRLFVPIAQAHLPAMAQTAARCVDRLSHLRPEAAGGLPLYRVFRRP